MSHGPWISPVDHTFYDQLQQPPQPQPAATNQQPATKKRVIRTMWISITYGSTKLANSDIGLTTTQKHSTSIGIPLMEHHFDAPKLGLGALLIDRSRIGSAYVCAHAKNMMSRWLVCYSHQQLTGISSTVTHSGRVTQRADQAWM